jgi:hypothetical protein
MSCVGSCTGNCNVHAGLAMEVVVLKLQVDASHVFSKSSVTD